jgi:AraC-like DNA-binding protein
MNYEQFASDLPLDRTISFSSVEENQEIMKQLDVMQEIRQLGKGKFHCNLLTQSFKQADLYSDRFSTAFSMVLEAPADSVGLLICRSPNGPFIASGEKAENDKLIFMPPGTGIDIISSNLTASDAITISESRFIEIIEAICPTNKIVQSKKIAVIEGNAVQLHALQNAIVKLVKLHEFELNQHEEQLSNLVTQSIVWMCHSFNQWRPEGFTVKSSKQHIARRVREYFECNYAQTIRMEDVCREVGVGLRTLQRSFKEYFQITPLSYLKIMRLNNAHRMLLANNSTNYTVTELAQNSGFNHMGRFSKEYYNFFEELPQNTLNRRV